MNETTEIISVAEAQNVLTEVNSLIDKLAKAEAGLEKGYARLGFLLTEVSEKGYWRGDYESFGAYMQALSERYGRGRTQLYAYFSTVRELKPYVDEKQLNDMGIAKAGEIKKAVQRTGFAPSETVIAQAVDPKVTVAQVRELLFKNDNPQSEQDKGNYRDLGGVYATADEWLEITKAFDLATRTDPVIQKSVPQPTRMKEILLRLSREYISTWEPEIERGREL